MPKKRSRRRPLSDEEREAKRAAERKKMEAAIAALRTSEGWQRWLDVRRHFHRYSFRNQLLIAHQCPNAMRVAGFRRWLEIGYAVRKGECGISIWAPCPPSRAKIRKWKEEGSNSATKPGTFFRLVPVFDRSQVDPLPEFPGGPLNLEPPIEPIEGDGLAALFGPLADFGATIGYAVAIEEIPGAALGYCSPTEKRITVEAVSADFSANAQVKTEIHELAHALVRAEREEDDPVLSRAEEEVVVECVAYTVCASVGLDTSGYSVTYLTSWSDGGEIERYAALIDRLAKRLEDVALAVQIPDREVIEEARIAA